MTPNALEMLAEPDEPVPVQLVRPLPSLPVEATLRSALATMRAHRVHLARGGRCADDRSFVAMEDVVEELIGEGRDVHAPERDGRG